MPEDQEQPQEVQEQLEQEEQSTKEVVEEEKPTKRKDAEYNFAELRKQREEDKRRADELERRLEEERRRNNEFLELLKQSKSAQTKEERDLLEEELSKLQQDDLATVANTEKIFAKHSKPTKKKIDEMEAKVAALEAKLEEQRIRAKFPDLDEVVTKENIETLSREEPELAQTLSVMKLGSPEQVSLAYKYIKKFVQPMPKQEDPMEKKKALENSKKPLSAQAAPKSSAIGNVAAFENGLTKELREQLYKEMKQAQKG